MESISGDNTSCQIIASSTKPSSKLLDHIFNEIPLKDVHTKLHHNNYRLTTVKDAINNSELNNIFDQSKSSNWISDFFSHEHTLPSLIHDKSLNLSISEKPQKSSWIDEHLFEKNENAWAVEFDETLSFIEKSNITNEDQLNNLFDRFEDTWKIHAPNEEEQWANQFSNLILQDHENSNDFTLKVDSLDPNDEVLESIWSQHTASANSTLLNSISRYQFEDNNPYLEHIDPLSLGLEIFNNPSGSLTEASLALEAAIQSLLQSENASTSLLTKAWYTLGNCQAENEKENAAIAAYENALKINPNSAEILLSLAVSLTNEAFDERVIQVLSTWLHIIDPNSSIDVDLLSREYLTSALLRVINCTTDPELASSLQVALGLLFYSAGVFERSIDCFKAALKSSPDDYLLWNRLGATLANSHQSEKAISMYEKALSIKPAFTRALHNMGISCMNVGCYSEAAEHLIQALKDQHIHPGLKNISINLWETLRRTFIFSDRVDLAALCETKSLTEITSMIGKGDYAWWKNNLSDLE